MLLQCCTLNLLCFQMLALLYTLLHLLVGAV